MTTTIQFVMANGWTTMLTRKEYLSTTFHFAGHPEGSLYEWKKFGGMLSINWVVSRQRLFSCRKTDTAASQCNNVSNNDVVATWRQANWAKKKLGQLLISQHYHGERELLLATAIAVEGMAISILHLSRSDHRRLFRNNARADGHDGGDLVGFCTASHTADSSS